MTALALLSLLFAAGPAILFMRNLRIFHPPSDCDGPAADVSILIPARNEARNIEAAVRAALTNAGAEVLVLDDLSTDDTAAIVLEMVKTELRLRLISGEALPDGWCGKNWACAQLADAATRPWFLFADADVRLAPHAAASLADWLGKSSAQSASGVPRQELGSFSERLLVPLIHFVLLGFLPLGRMRASRHPAYATGCGQLIIANAEAYRTAGGHAAICGKIHDGLALPKAFRETGLRTDLFDPTELATCRMYRSNTETWRGLSKNTHEGLGAPARIVPATLMLSLGQVLPFLLLPCAWWLTTFQFVCVATAAASAFVVRLVAARRFRQPFAIGLLHPFAIAALLGIQWAGLVRYLQRRPTTWKARQYDHRANLPLVGVAVSLAARRKSMRASALVRQRESSAPKADVRIS